MKALFIVALLGALCVAQAAIVLRFNVVENAAKHRTLYRNKGSVNQTADLIVRAYDPVTVSATQDPFPVGAEFVLFDDLSGLSPIGNGKKPAEWKIAASVSQDRKSLTFTWDKPFIGRFLFGIRTNNKLVFLSRARVFILFNPWNPKDATSPSADDANPSIAKNFAVDLNEYVLNEYGAVWRGSANSNSPMAWNYGHMDLQILDTVMGLIAPLAPEQRNAVLVSRFLTVAAQGVLEGRWPEDPNDYPGGNPPGTWTSSVQILYQYAKSGTVKYGQCWVFSSLYTALGRTLGIPTLSITNFDSAHEQQPFRQQCHMRSVGPNAVFSRRISTCSIWNFHVWNHVYIRRTDIPGASGWQAVDATPQETSKDGPNENPFNEENYFTGPASLNLMRRGAYTTKYDTAFVGGESNAVIYRYHCAKNDIKTCTQSEVVNNQVGEKMYAKAPDSMTRSNVRTDAGYTRIAFINWARAYSNVSTFFLEVEGGPTKSLQSHQQQSLESGQSEQQSLGSAHEANVTEKRSMSFSVQVPSQLTLGNRFRVALTKQAGAKLTGKWMLTLVVRSVNYMTGAAIGPDHLVIHQVVNDMATNKQGLVRRFGNELWSNSTFLAALAKSSYLSFVFSAVPANSNHKLFLTVETVNVLRPTLPVICGNQPNPKRHKETYVQGETMHCVIKFYNPLKVAITGIKVQMTVSGLVAKEELKQLEAQQQHKGLKQETTTASASDVDSSGQSVAGFRTIVVGGFQFALNATAGKQQISATFLSNQLRDVFGSNHIVIKPNPKFAKAQAIESKHESQAAKQDADGDAGQTQDVQQAETKAAETLQKAKKAVELAFNSKKASIGEKVQQVAKKITLIQHSKDTQKSK